MGITPGIIILLNYFQDNRVCEKEALSLFGHKCKSPAHTLTLKGTAALDIRRWAPFRVGGACGKNPNGDISEKEPYKLSY